MRSPEWIVDFWLDPSCPLTRLTARWLVGVAGRRSIEIRWRVMSLTILNEGKDVDPEGDPEGYLRIPARICAAVQTEHGHEALGRFYDALWTDPRGGDGDWIDAFDAALRRARLPEALAAVGFDESYDAALRASHEAAMSLVGDDVGTPILAITDSSGARHAWFGPVITELPAEADALRLWDGFVLVAGVREFRELKR